jgi:hypothetical protein
MSNRYQLNKNQKTKKMKTKKMIIALFFAAATVTGFAQTASETSGPNFMLGAFGGLNIPQLAGGGGTPLTDGYKSLLGPTYGLASSMKLKSNFALKAAVYYSKQGGTRNGMQAISASSFNPQAPKGTYLYADIENKSVMEYIGVHLLLRYSIPISKNFGFFADLGPHLGFLQSAHQITSGSSIVYADATGTQPVTVNTQTGKSFAVPFDANTDIINSLHNVTSGITGGIGFSQGVGFGDIFLDIRMQYGLTTIQKYAIDGRGHIGKLAIALGYSIPL